MIRRTPWTVSLAALAAMLVQLIVPGWAFMEMASFSLDPAANAPICAAHSDPDHGGSTPHEHGVFCPICLLACHASQAVIATSPGCPVPAATSAASGCQYRVAVPRGPPSLFAQARAPPTTL
jgi:hypothetical protein